ncbi:transcription initiation factor IIA subunit 1-like [Artemia franciscana]|uniref:Transcription initiation factor IIA subunit 1 n=1 Tax=Artemia franciscana TaxID=6661 RepID=A0AA88KXP2_ARTSF|nr:hypothetical protein QYM36_012559 [Artemia franciscana]
MVTINPVAKFYRQIIEDVTAGVKDAFLDEGYDDTVLGELKQLWETKLQASKVLRPQTDTADHALQHRLNEISRGGGVHGGQAGTSNQVLRNVPSNIPTAGSVSMVPVKISVPGPPGAVQGPAKVITVQVPATFFQVAQDAGAQLQAILGSPRVTQTLSLPVETATRVLQEYMNDAIITYMTSRGHPRPVVPIVSQMDGTNDSSDEDDDDDIDDTEDADDDLDLNDDEIDQENEEVEEDEPLNSEDDVSDDDVSQMFETDNVVVCQFDKITRTRNRWKFHLKDGVMNINGRDYVFQKANGDTEW